MSRDRQLEQRPAGLLPGLIDGWLKILTHPSQNEYLAQLSKTGFIETLIGTAILGLSAGLYAAAVGNFPFIPGSTNAISRFLLAIFLTSGGFFLLNFFLYLLVKALGGSGSYIDQCSLLSLIAAPLGSVLLLVLFAAHSLGLQSAAVLNPLSATGILGAILLLLAIYSLVQVLLSLQIVHQVKAVKAFYALGVLLALGGILRVVAMFATHQDTLITRVLVFIIQQWAGGYLQAALLGHFWLVLFSVIIAVIIGVVMGVLITMPVSRPRAAHLFFSLPLILFFVVWAASAGLFGEAAASQISATVRTWDRSLRGVDGFFGELCIILGAILRKPAALGLVGMVLTAVFYVLLLFGEKASGLTLYVAGIILTIPSIALFGVLIRPLGIGAFNAAFALILYAQLPILRNTYTGINEVQPEIVEAGRGMGMTEFQLLTQVKLPLAMPVIMTGLRVSTVMLVGIAAIAAYIGTNTLGDYIFSGIQRAQEVRYITGAFVVAALALSVDFLLGRLQDRLTPLAFKARFAARQNEDPNPMEQGNTL